MMDHAWAEGSQIHMFRVVGKDAVLAYATFITVQVSRSGPIGRSPRAPLPWVLAKRGEPLHISRMEGATETWPRFD